MSGSDQNSSSDFLGQRFITCPKCGELTITDGQFCHFCGASLTDSSAQSLSQSSKAAAENSIKKIETPLEAPLEASSVDQNPALLIASAMPGIDNHPADSAHVARVPSEYYRDFDPGGFCWPAFWFADLWHADKGLAQQAWKHFVVRMFTIVSGVAMVIVLFTASIEAESGSSSEAAVGAGILFILWLGSLGFSAVLSYLDARSALKRYYALATSSTPDQLTQKCEAARRSYWVMLYTPFILYLVAFMTMLLIVGGDNSSNKTDALGKALFMLFNIH